MLALAAALSLLMGTTLGLLGGGGSILTVPILIYALGIPAKQAIATSLWIVATTSAVGTIQHARKNNVEWKTGILFSIVAMLGAYGGGYLAKYFDGDTLLLLFVGLMLVTSVLMFRKKKSTPSCTSNKCTPSSKKQKASLIILEGLVVGAVTGLVGAGGGFVVVPALVLLGGLDMKKAIGTSLFVISLKSLAGLAGHLQHVSIDLSLATWISAFAILGTFLGVQISKKISSQHLQKLFGAFVISMATWMLYKEGYLGMFESIWIEPWPFWLGGIAVGLFVILFLLFGHKPLGVSSGFQDVCMAPFETKARRSWRIPFMIGIIGGGTLAAFMAGTLAPQLHVGLVDKVFELSLISKALLFTGGGILVGFGARLAGGCTSGHGITGMAQLAPSSLISTLAFMFAGVMTANLMFRILGGWS